MPGQNRTAATRSAPQLPCYLSTNPSARSHKASRGHALTTCTKARLAKHSPHSVHSPFQKSPPRIFSLSLGTACGKENSSKHCTSFSVRLQFCHRFIHKPPLPDSSGSFSRQNPPNLQQLNFLSLSRRKSFHCSGL